MRTVTLVDETDAPANLAAVVYSADGPSRARVERFLETTYAKAFGGTIRRHFPQLLSLEDRAGRVHAAVGFRRANTGPLFLEQYLDAPVEAALELTLGQAVPRSAIAEVGSLASDSPCASLRLFAVLAGRLEALGCTHAVATATQQLRRSFARLDLPVHFLARADVGRLRDGRSDWGGYYDRAPQVLAGAINAARPLLSREVLGARVAAKRLAQRTSARCSSAVAP